MIIFYRASLHHRWNLVASAEVTDPKTIGSTCRIQFKDGVVWTVQILELSQLKRFVTFDVISSEPASHVTSTTHTITLSRVTSNNSTFFQWSTDFSNDATAEIVADSSHKKLEAFQNLTAIFTAAAESSAL
jgi:hypothetical protein